MCTDPAAELPEVFYGRYLFWAELTPEEGLKLRPTFITSPRGDAPKFERLYRRMEGELAQAAEAIEAARPLVPQHCRLTFDAEASSTLWFYRTCRTHANFYESCRLRDGLRGYARHDPASSQSDGGIREHYRRWRDVLTDERDNTAAALPLAEADVRLDFHYGGDHTFSHTSDMIRAKLGILDHELSTVLPRVWDDCQRAAARR
jgi:hypothetical protein